MEECIRFSASAERRMIMATGFNTQVGNGEYRLQFETDNKEYYLLMQETARRRVDGKPVTNADRIRAMSDEELKKFICSMLKCKYCQFEIWGRCELLKWLQQPAENDKKWV